MFNFLGYMAGYYHMEYNLISFDNIDFENRDKIILYNGGQ